MEFKEGFVIVVTGDNFGGHSIILHSSDHILTALTMSITTRTKLWNNINYDDVRSKALEYSTKVKLFRNYGTKFTTFCEKYVF